MGSDQNSENRRTTEPFPNMCELVIVMRIIAKRGFR